MPRTSKASILASIDQRILAMAIAYKAKTGRSIDPSNGTAQVPTGDTHAHYLYGIYDGLRNIYDDIESGYCSG